MSARNEKKVHEVNEKDESRVDDNEPRLKLSHLEVSKISIIPRGYEVSISIFT